MDRQNKVCEERSGLVNINLIICHSPGQYVLLHRECAAGAETGHQALNKGNTFLTTRRRKGYPTSYSQIRDLEVSVAKN